MATPSNDRLRDPNELTTNGAMVGQDTPRAQSVHLTRVYVAALGLLALLVLAREVVVGVLLRQQQSEAATINIAGRQRMLSQKLSKALLLVQEPARPVDWEAQLERDLTLWEESHQRVLGESVDGPLDDSAKEFNRLLELLEPDYQAMMQAASTVLRASRGPEENLPQLRDQGARFLAHEGRYLTLMNEVVSAFERRATKQVDRLRTVDLALSVLILLALVLEAVFVFRPIVAKVARTLRELEEAKLGAEATAQRDGLTGIANRHRFDAEYERDFRRAARQKNSIAVLMIDLDGFKSLNDRAGHHEGDACLVRIAACLAEQMRRPGDLVARYGGDEFVVCLPDTSYEGGQAVARRLQKAVSELGIAIPEDGNVGASVGVAAQVPNSSDLDPFALVRLADRALYEQKSARRTIRLTPAASA